MTTRAKMLLLLAFATTAAAVILGSTQHWRYWPAGLIVPIALLAALAAGRTGHADSVNAVAEPAAPTPAAVQHFREAFDRDTAVANVPVLTASANYEFLLSATVHWRPSPAAPVEIAIANPGTLATNAIIDRATKQTSIENPVDYVQAQYRLAALLAVVHDDPSGQLKVWATDVTLSMHADDIDRLRRRDELNKQRELWEQQREIEREVAAYFGEEVLKTPGSAVAWWMAQRHERRHDEIERAVDLIGPLAQLAAAANNEEVPEPFRRLVEPRPAYSGPEAFGEPTTLYGGEYPGEERWDEVAEPQAEPTVLDFASGLIEKLGYASGSEEHASAARLLANWCERLGKDEAAARVREAYNIVDFSDTTPNGFSDHDDQAMAGDAN
jgi:hypothetical protein